MHIIQRKLLLIQMIKTSGNEYNNNIDNFIINPHAKFCCFFFKFLRRVQLESVYRIVFCKRKPFFFSGFMIIYTGEIVTCAIYMTLNLPQN